MSPYLGVTMEGKDKHQVKLDIEILRLTTIGLLTVGGGVVSLILDRSISGGKNFFIAIGLILVIILVIFLMKSIIDINRLMK